MKYKASCHCGKIALEFDGEMQEALACNCSMCQRKGSLLWFMPRPQVTLLTPEEAASEYLFNKHLIHHRFCPTCGIHPYAVGTDRQGRDMIAVNVRCIEDIDLSTVPVKHIDGRSLR
jgi:hypothetical protein